ncbi:uncharacterized protein LOC127834484 isoform X2 [Dreissena polymorpha]|uniref:uncharacterized protein LOC127834484 isoform X2 n=1 Tax=Dreissena polymorpha TaxID=45954 RepID=UPI00226488EF|nr:uncharacterized protein LOC127834484 isoform X2 [Dreissena polymorpha]
MADFEKDLEYAVKELKIEFSFSDYQLRAMKSLYENKDTIAVLPTGSGKSLIFQTLPWLLQGKMAADRPMIVLVISPLNSLMQDQVISLCERGISACYISIDASTVTTCAEVEETKSEECSDEEMDKKLKTSAGIESIKNGHFNIIYLHPETVFVKEIGKLLRSSVFRGRVCCTVIDEVHMVAEWGSDFRQSFNRLGELTCLFPRVPHLAVTATATPSALEELIALLQFKNCTKVLANPDRPNIYLEKKERLPNIHKFEKYDLIMSEVLAQLKDKYIDFPVTIMHCDNLESLGYCFQLLCHELGTRAYFPESSTLPEDRIVAQFHKDYTERMKIHIISELRKQNPKVRLVLATVALGMGLNAPSIATVIHMRPPTTLEKYMQEIGRAGRNGKPAKALCYFNTSDIAKNRKGLDNAMRAYIQNTDKCLRLHLVGHFGYNSVLFSGEKAMCCSNCKVTSAD